MPSFTREEVSKHNSEADCWIVIGKNVYNVTKFLPLHPGGKKLLLNFGGKDATKEFQGVHRPEVLQKYSKLVIGTLDEPETARYGKQQDPSLSVVIPYAEPYWYDSEFQSPYYKQTHHDFRKKCRLFFEKEIAPFLHEWNEAGGFPEEIPRKAYEAGLFAPAWPKEFGGTPPDNFDAFHDLIIIDEFARSGAGGFQACFWSFGIALPPILAVGSDYLKNLVARDVITGKKVMSLAVTEPWAGSDVANLRTTARREGDFYVVNGEKKYITSGMKADYFTVAVRTGDRGLSLLLIDANSPGITKRRMKTQGWWTSNTAYLIFEDVRVPIRNLIGEENKGFAVIMYNFNHERFALAAMANRAARTCIEEAIKYARVRNTFGKRLADHQVIRHKIADMASRVEAVHALIEQICYQMNQGVSAFKIAGVVSLAKVQATRTMEFCAREASQILGGASYVRGGVGEKIERIYREVRVHAIGGGSEEILFDLAMRQAKL